MSNNLVQTPVGIDYPIQLLQTYLYERLYNLWGTTGLTSDTFDMFGRVYRNKTADGFVPEWYKGLKEYGEDLFHNDRIAVHMYFGLNDPTKSDNAYQTSNISLYVWCNIQKLYPEPTTQRQDEQVIMDVVRMISDGNRYGFKVTDYYRDIDNVTAKFSGFAKSQAQVNNNMQPKLAFRIDMENSWNLFAYTACTAPNATPLYFNAMTGYIQAVFKETPSDLLQTLVNGVRIPLEYPVGNTLTIPHLVGRYVFDDVVINGTVYNTNPVSVNYIPYDMTTGTFTYGSDYPNDGFQPEVVLSLKCNENS